jgi:putative FmdB family regulatory protein
MPFYEYRCDECGRAFEELIRSMSAPVKVKCPSCGGKKVTQQFSVFSAQTASPSSPGKKCMSCSDGSCPNARG